VAREEKAPARLKPSTTNRHGSLLALPNAATTPSGVLHTTSRRLISLEVFMVKSTNGYYVIWNEKSSDIGPRPNKPTSERTNNTTDKWTIASGKAGMSALHVHTSYTGTNFRGRSSLDLHLIEANLTTQWTLLPFAAIAWKKNEEPHAPRGGSGTNL